MILCRGHSFYYSKRKTKFHKVEYGNEGYPKSVTISQQIVSISTDSTPSWLAGGATTIGRRFQKNLLRRTSLRSCVGSSVFVQTQAHSWAIRVEASEQKQSAQVCKLASQTLRDHFASFGLHVQMLSNTCFGALRKKRLGPNLAHPTSLCRKML